MKNRKGRNNNSSKLRAMLDKLNEDYTGMKNTHQVDNILNMIRKDSDPLKKPVETYKKEMTPEQQQRMEKWHHHYRSIDIDPPKSEYPSAIDTYEELKESLEDLEHNLKNTTDLLDGALAQPGESSELLAYISEMTQEHASLIKEVKEIRIKLGLDKA